ncbi:MAG: hypothetical protein AB7L76_23670 [Burkholderiaceae bacterium]
MRIDSHLRKWRRFDACRARFDPLAEFELWYWATLSGGTALINAALHAAGVTEENDLFCTQVAEVYLLADGLLPLRRVVALRSDLIHVGLPEIDAELPDDIEQAFAVMYRIERYRDPCVRSTEPITAELVADCAGSYRALVGAVAQRIGIVPAPDA